MSSRLWILLFYRSVHLMWVCCWHCFVFDFWLNHLLIFFPKWFIIRVFKFPAATQCGIHRRISTLCPLVARWLNAGWTLVERWWPAGCPNPPSTSDLGLPHNVLGYGVNKVVFEQLRASCVDWPFYFFEKHFLLPTFLKLFFFSEKKISKKNKNDQKLQKNY